VGDLAHSQVIHARSLSLFAGKPIVKAHELAESQDWSGCVFAPSAKSILDQTATQIPEDLRLVLAGEAVNHDVSFSARPSGEVIKKQMLCLNWPNTIRGIAMDIPLTTFVERQFGRHNKDASAPSVQRKIANTVEFMSQFWIRGTNNNP